MPSNKTLQYLADGLGRPIGDLIAEQDFLGQSLTGSALTDASSAGLNPNDFRGSFDTVIGITEYLDESGLVLGSIATGLYLNPIATITKEVLGDNLQYHCYIGINSP